MDRATLARLIEMQNRDEQPGHCTACGSIDNPAEPDQDAGFCEDCEQYTVRGIEYILLDTFALL